VFEWRLRGHHSSLSFAYLIHAIQLDLSLTAAQSFVGMRINKTLNMLTIMAYSVVMPLYEVVSDCFYAQFLIKSLTPAVSQSSKSWTWHILRLGMPMNPKALRIRIRFNKYILRLSYLKWIWISISALCIMNFYTRHFLGVIPGKATFPSIHTYKQLRALPTINSNKSSSVIESIHILGERNSGTTWMYEYVIYTYCIELCLHIFTCIYLFNFLDYFL